jgi:hypothetical protein
VGRVVTTREAAVGASFDLRLPAASWLELPLHLEDATPWAASQAADLLVDGTAHETRAALAVELNGHAARARDAGCDVAIALVPDPAAGVLAVLSVRSRAYAGTLDDLAVELRHATTDLVRPTELSYVDLPTGRALRAHAMTALPDSDEQDAEKIVEESVGYFLLTESGLILVQMRWAAIALGDELIRLADEGACGFQLT